MEVELENRYRPERPLNLAGWVETAIKDRSDKKSKGYNDVPVGVSVLRLLVEMV